MRLKKADLNNLRVENILSVGYFPENLPPCFSSTQLGEFYKKLNAQQLAEISSKKKKIPAVEQVNILGARYGGLVRRFSIPSPLAYLALAKEFEESKNEISSHIDKTNFSASLPTTGHKYRAIGRTYRFNELNSIKKQLSRGMKYYIKSDISHYYPSIYTHAVSWALHDKLKAKKEKNNFNLLGNRIDKFVSLGQYGETKGIPIGPDTSHVISEILLSKIDEKLTQSVERGFRYMDDYWFFINNLSEADEVLGKLQTLLGRYHLYINPVKTELAESINSFDPEWLGELKINIQKYSNLSADKLESLVVEIKNKYPHTPVIKYLFKIVQDKSKSYRPLERLKLLSICVDKEHALVLDFIKYINWKIPIFTKQDIDFILNKFEEWIPKCILSGYQIELSWILWFLIAMQWHLSEESCKKIKLVESDFISLLLLVLIDKGLCKRLDVPLLEDVAQLHDSPDYLGNWLFRYQCCLEKWLDPGKLELLGLKEIFASGASFFDEKLGKGEWIGDSDGYI